MKTEDDVSSGAHLSQEMLQRFADLETAEVDARTVAHAESCDVCSERIAEAALATLRVHDLLISASASVALSGAVLDGVSDGVSDGVPDGVSDGAAAGRASAPSPAFPLLIAVLVAAFASLPLASDWVSRTTHLRLVWEAAVRMFEPVWSALTSPTVQIAATTAAVVLCLIIVMPLARQAQMEVKS